MTTSVEAVGQGPRAVAVVRRDGEVLVIKRHCDGVDYAVLPGGSVEPGETFEEATVRELGEETTLRARVERQLLGGEHNGREARYFLMADVQGSPRLSGSELEAHNPDNSFELMWAGPEDLHELALHPAHLRTDLPLLLGLESEQGGRGQHRADAANHRDEPGLTSGVSGHRPRN